MALTQKQEWLITQFERQLFAGLGELPDMSRKRIQTRLRREIIKRLNQYASPVDDLMVQEVLVSFGDPVAAGTALLNAETQVAAVKPKPPTSREHVFTLSPEDSRWLGVCKGMSHYFSLDVRLIRAFFVLLGLLSGPVAIGVYLALYFKMHFAAERDDAPPIKYITLLKSVGGAVLGLGVMHILLRLLLWGVAVGFMRLTDKPAPLNLNGLEWLVLHNGYALFLASLTTLPFAVLAGLPLTNRWEDTMQRLTYACLALYAVGLCLGFGAYVAGLILVGTRLVP